MDELFSKLKSNEIEQ
jgi:hypothetical protein